MIFLYPNTRSPGNLLMQCTQMWKHNSSFSVQYAHDISDASLLWRVTTQKVYWSGLGLRHLAHILACKPRTFCQILIVKVSGSAYMRVRIKDTYVYQLGWWRWKAADVVMCASWVSVRTVQCCACVRKCNLTPADTTSVCSVLAPLKRDHLPVMRLWFSQISAGL